MGKGAPLSGQMGSHGSDPPLAYNPPPGLRTAALPPCPLLTPSLSDAGLPAVCTILIYDLLWDKRGLFSTTSNWCGGNCCHLSSGGA